AVRAPSPTAGPASVRMPAPSLSPRHGWTSRRGDPEDDLPGAVPGVEPLVGPRHLLQGKYVADEGAHEPLVDHPADLLQPLPLAGEEDAVDRLVPEVHGGQVACGGQDAGVPAEGAGRGRAPADRVPTDGVAHREIGRASGRDSV